MSQSTARKKRRTPAKRTNGSAPAPEPTPEAVVEEPGMSHPAILVMRIPGEKPGEERIEMAELNGIDPLAVPTTLRLAARIKDTQLGIGEGK